MKKTTYIHLAMDNAFLSKGFESVIHSLDPQIDTSVIESFEDLSNYTFSSDFKNILIFDYCIHKNENALLLRKLLKNYPKLKVAILVDSFNYEKIKTLFNTGIVCVIDSKINADDFAVFVTKVSQGEKFISPTIKQQIIDQFCKKESNESFSEVQLNVAESINYSGEVFSLTKREREVLHLICDGKNTKEISEELYISTHTAETHRRHLLGKLDVRNTAQMVKKAIVNRLIPVG